VQLVERRDHPGRIWRRVAGDGRQPHAGQDLHLPGQGDELGRNRALLAAVTLLLDLAFDHRTIDNTEPSLGLL
jgi:hypothetical protein